MPLPVILIASTNNSCATDKTIEEIDELFEGVHFNIDEERDVKVIEGVEEKTPQAIVADKSSSKGSEEH